MAPLEPEIERSEHQQRDDELDPEMVGVSRQRVRTEHLLRPADCPEYVDPGLPRGDGLDQGSVEVRARELRKRELNHAVQGVQGDPSEERGQGQPVERERAPREERDARHQEAEVEHELDHSLRPLRERLRRVERVEASEVHEREREEEDEGDHGRAREPRVAALEPVPDEDDQKDGREDVGERE